MFSPWRAYSVILAALTIAIAALISSLAADQDDYIFAVTENSGHVAMVLIEKSVLSLIFLDEVVKL